LAIENPEHEYTDLPASGFWTDAELERLWVEEAERRYQDYLDGKEETVPGLEVIRRLRATLR